MLDLAATAQGVAQIEGYYLDRQQRTMPDERPVRITCVSPGYLDMLGSS